MKTLLSALFGTYTPITYVNDSGIEIVADGLAGCDWEYILGVLLFAIVLYSALRLVGILFKR